jgi:hypothetical protein
VFRARWSWMVPLAGATLVFFGVLLTTPPGFGAVRDVILLAPSGSGADAAAYALGSAASLALVTLAVVGVACGSLEVLLRKMAHRRA